MKRILVSLLILFAVLLVILAGFSLYAHFLVDYSLETLAFALDTTEKKADQDSTVARQVYKEMVQDLVSDQIGSEKADLKDLALLEMASRSFDESVDRDGYARAKVYLSQVVDQKKKGGNLFQQAAELIYGRIQGFYQFVASFTGYLKKKALSEDKKKKDSYEFSSIYLLEQAQEREKKLDYGEAADFYRKFLGLYPAHSDRGYVKIALAQLLMKQRRVNESKKILGDVQIEFAGREEQRIAAKLMKRLDALKDKSKAIQSLKTEIRAAAGSEKKALMLKLAAAYLSVAQIENAEALLKTLMEDADPEVSRQAKIYMAWVYKMRKQYGEGEEVLQQLLEGRDLGADLELGLRAQLADIYYQKGDVKASLAQYKTLSEKVSALPVADSAKGQLLASRVSKEAWKSLSEMEQANIYLFDLQDAEKAQEHLSAAGSFSKNFDMKEIQERFKAAASNTLRDKGFAALQNNQVGLAFELFKRNLKLHPEDAHTHSGIATVYILLGMLDEAMKSAQEGFRIEADNYTTSILAYVYDASEKYAEALPLYEKAMMFKGDYFPAKFNLSCVLLKIGKYQRAFELLVELEGLKTVQETVNFKIRVLNNMGCALWHLGRKEEALTRFNEALELNPDFVLVKKNLNLIFVSGKSPEGGNAKDDFLNASRN